MPFFPESIEPADQVRIHRDASWTTSAAENTPALSLLSVHFEPSRPSVADAPRSTDQKTYQSPYAGRVRNTIPDAQRPNSQEAPQGTKPNEASKDVPKELPKEPPKATVDPNRDFSAEFRIAYHSVKAFEKFDIDDNKFLSEKELKTIAESWYGPTWTETDKRAAKYLLQNYQTVKSMYDEPGNSEAHDANEKFTEPSKEQSTDQSKYSKIKPRYQTKDQDFSVNQSDKVPKGPSEKYPYDLSKDKSQDFPARFPQQQQGISLQDTIMFAHATSPNFDPTSAARWETFHAVKYPLATCIGSGVAAGVLYATGILPKSRAALAKAAAVSGIYVATELSNHNSKVQRYTDLQTNAASLTKAPRS